MKQFLTILYGQKYLTRLEAREALLQLASGTCSDAEIGAFLSVYNMRPVSSLELLGFRDAMLECALRPTIDAKDAIDVCGTGGDGKDTFNISTASAFVLAACGVRVLKHGNYSVSSSCGSSNVLEALGVRFATNASQLAEQYAAAGIGFLHAPLFHPAMKHVASARKALGVRTFFNILGPLSNPACPGLQVAGVASPDLVRLYESIFQEVGQQFAVVHSLDGYDECSLTGKTIIVSSRETSVVTPEELGLQEVLPDDLQAPKTLAENASLLQRILAGEGSPAQQSVVAANAGIGLFVANQVQSLREGVAVAGEVLRGGKAEGVLRSVIN